MGGPGGAGADGRVLVTADSESYAEGELDEARQLAARIGLLTWSSQTRELDNPEYAANPPNRCFFCKEELFAHLEPHRPGGACATWSTAPPSTTSATTGRAWSRPASAASWRP